MEDLNNIIEALKPGIRAAMSGEPPQEFKGCEITVKVDGIDYTLYLECVVFATTIYETHEYHTIPMDVEIEGCEVELCELFWNDGEETDEELNLALTHELEKLIPKLY